LDQKKLMFVNLIKVVLCQNKGDLITGRKRKDS